MKGLFDELNAILPNSPGSKSSKWEILTKCMFVEQGFCQGVRLTASQRSSISRTLAERTTTHELKSLVFARTLNSAEGLKKRMNFCATSY